MGLALLRRNKQEAPAGAWRAVRLSNLASALERDNKPTAALVLYRRALAEAPHDLRVRANLAAALEKLGQIEEAAAVLAESPPDEPRAWLTRAFLKLHGGDVAGALECYSRAHELDPTDPDAAIGIATTLLLLGDWERGWTAFAATVGRTSWGPALRWDGGKVKRLLVYADQGMGDIFNFCRYLPWAAERADHVVFVLSGNLKWLLRWFDVQGGKVSITNQRPETVENIDAQIALSCLPGLAGARPDKIAAPFARFQVDPVELGPRAGRKRVGICWAGNAQYAQDRRRSTSLDALLPLAADPAVDLYSFQAGPRAADIVALGAASLVRDLSGVIANEWSLCAGALKHMDALVTTDTAIAHLAGSIGVRTFLCLPRVCDWRWLWDRADTPWYPGVTLVRQQRQGDWADVIARVGALLAREL